MNVLKWSPEKRLLVELRKAVRGAAKAGAAAEPIVLAPVSVPDDIPLERDESILAEVTNQSGRRFYFSATALFIESTGRYVRLPFTAVVACDWITDAGGLAAKLPLKGEFGDRLILRDSEGIRYELNSLGVAFQGMHNFFNWLLRRGDGPSNKPLQPTSGGPVGAQ
jgi:hypothetical protein